MWTRTSTCRQNGYGFTAPYPYEVTAGGAAAGELLGGVTGSRRILIRSERIRKGKGLKSYTVYKSCTPSRLAYLIAYRLATMLSRSHALQIAYRAHARIR